MANVKNKQQFLEKFQQVLGDKFNLTSFEFGTRLEQKIKLTCKVCNTSTLRLYNNLFKSQGCRICSPKKAANSLYKAKCMSKESFLKLLPQDISYEVISEEIHLNRAVLVKDTFGICEVIGRQLTKGVKPSLVNAVDRNSYRINCYRAIHGDNFTYPNYNYISNNSKLHIVCNRCGKSDVIIECNHIKKNSGCKVCDTTLGAPPITHEDFLIKVSQINPNLEVLSTYIGYHGKLLFKNKYGICEGQAGNLLRGFSGSLRGSLDKTSYMIEQFKEKHDNKYTYSNYKYCGNRCAGTITCPIHGDFEQLTDVHLMGCGCNKCGQEGRVNGFGRTDFINMANGRECTYYIIKCSNEFEEFFKMGITARSIKERYKTKDTMPYDYETLFSFESVDAAFIWDTELEIKRLYKDFKYEPEKFFKGRTECFTLDVPLEEIKNLFKNTETSK